MKNSKVVVSSISVISVLCFVIFASGAYSASPMAPVPAASPMAPVPAKALNMSGETHALPPTHTPPDFTFHVPVEIGNIPPDITSFRIWCAVSVMATAEGTGTPAYQIAKDSEPITITGGNYSGTVSISFDVDPAVVHIIDRTNRWDCGIRFRSDAGSYIGWSYNGIMQDPTQKGYPVDYSKSSPKDFVTGGFHQ